MEGQQPRAAQLRPVKTEGVDAVGLDSSRLWRYRVPCPWELAFWWRAAPKNWARVARAGDGGSGKEKPGVVSEGLMCGTFPKISGQKTRKTSMLRDIYSTECK